EPAVRAAVADVGSDPVAPPAGLQGDAAGRQGAAHVIAAADAVADLAREPAGVAIDRDVDPVGAGVEDADVPLARDDVEGGPDGDLFPLAVEQAAADERQAQALARDDGNRLVVGGDAVAALALAAERIGPDLDGDDLGLAALDGV